MVVDASEFLTVMAGESDATVRSDVKVDCCLTGAQAAAPFWTSLGIAANATSAVDTNERRHDGTDNWLWVHAREKYVRIVTLGFIQRNYVGNTTAMRKSLGFVIGYTSSKVPFCWSFSAGVSSQLGFIIFFVFPSASVKRLASLFIVEEGRVAYLVV